MIHVCEHHDEVLAHWREEDRRGIRLAHVDFHDDLRGLLVDRRRDVAYPIRALAGPDPPGVDPGNFLAHALLEGRLDAVRWVHDTPGGRGWDMGIVRYESDLLAWPDRRRHRRRGGPELSFRFEEIALREWNGPRPGELLSIDWDCFASILQDRAGLDARVEAFFACLDTATPPATPEATPEATWIAYSPEYCHETLDQFRVFVDRLAARYDQPVRWRSAGLRDGTLSPSGVDARLPRGLAARLTLWLRRLGIT